MALFAALGNLLLPCVIVAGNVVVLMAAKESDRTLLRDGGPFSLWVDETINCRLVGSL